MTLGALVVLLERLHGAAEEGGWEDSPAGRVRDFLGDLVVVARDEMAREAAVGALGEAFVWASPGSVHGQHLFPVREGVLAGESLCGYFAPEEARVRPRGAVGIRCRACGDALRGDS